MRKKEEGQRREIGDRSLTGGPGETGLSSEGNHYGNTIALSGIMERRGEEEAKAARAGSSVMLMLFSWTEAVLHKNPASTIL